MAITSIGLNKMVPATGCYMGLHTANPTEAGTSEATGGSYARQPVNFTAATSGSKVCTLSNTPTFTLQAGVYTHYSIRDALNGAIIDIGMLTPQKTIEANGDQIQITTGSIALS